MSNDPRPHQYSPPTVARIIRLSDFCEADALFSNWQGRFEQLSRGRFDGKLQIVRGGLIRIIHIEANQRVLLRGHDSAGLFSVYPISDGNAADLWQGHRLAPGQLVLSGSHAEVDHCSARRTSSLGLSLRPEALEEAARALLSAEVVALPRTWEVASPPPAVFGGLITWLTRLLELGMADPSLLGAPEGNQIEQECVRSLVECLFSASAPRPRVSPPARSRILRGAEEFMRSRLGDPVGSIDLCRELGVSDRTLRLAFRERFGLGPMAYYKCLRLNAVRSRLKADPATTVSQTARAYGFHHPGNFAADYRRLFGQPPSTTPRPAFGGPATPTCDLPPGGHAPV